jgi:hypothetical protein
MNILHNDYLYANELSTLLSTCRTLLIFNANFNIAYVRWQVNRIPHNFASVYLFQYNPNVHHYYPLDCTSSIILNEIQDFNLLKKNSTQVKYF